MVLRIEKQKENRVHFGENVKQSASYVSSGHTSNFSSRIQKQTKEGDKLCMYCKETNHVKDNCFKLVAYLEWWKGKKKSLKPSKPTHYAHNVLSTPFDLSNSNDGEDFMQRKKDNAMLELI